MKEVKFSVTNIFHKNKILASKHFDEAFFSDDEGDDGEVSDDEDDFGVMTVQS